MWPIPNRIGATCSQSHHRDVSRRFHTNASIRRHRKHTRRPTTQDGPPLDVETPPSLMPDDPSCPRAGGAIRLAAVPVSVATSGSQTGTALSHTRMHSSARMSGHYIQHCAMTECNQRAIVQREQRPVHNYAAAALMPHHQGCQRSPNPSCSSTTPPTSLQQCPLDCIPMLAAHRRRRATP